MLILMTAALVARRSGRRADVRRGRSRTAHCDGRDRSARADEMLRLLQGHGQEA